jgi:hypothetical protein
MFLARTFKKILPNATVLKQTTEMKPYCILKGKARYRINGYSDA